MANETGASMVLEVRFDHVPDEQSLTLALVAVANELSVIGGYIVAKILTTEENQRQHQGT
jgi:hypothetical protein